MARLDIEKIAIVGIYDDDTIDMDIISDIINVNNQEDAFYICDIEKIVQKHKKWLSAMPRVFPHYAVKCNPNDTVINVLAALNCRFDCASKGEIQQVMRAGVPSDRIIYANPSKLPSHIRFAKEVGVDTLIIDNMMEVSKIKEIYPKAKLVIRLLINGDSCGVNFTKFGCEPTTETIALMSFIKEQEMSLRGFSFHLGSPCWDANSYGRGIEICKKLIKMGTFLGFKEVNLIDIGGGFPGLDEPIFHKIIESINGALEDLDPSIRVISEPGRYYVESAFTLATFIHGKRLILDNAIMKRHYYVNDGIFGSFHDVSLNLRKHVPIPLYKHDEKLYQSVIWGPTCDSVDCIIENTMIEDLSVGNWMVWGNMGSYTIAIASTFNGYTPSAIFPIIRKTALRELLDAVNFEPKLKKKKNDEETRADSDIVQEVR